MIPSEVLDKVIAELKADLVRADVRADEYRLHKTEGDPTELAYGHPDWCELTVRLKNKTYDEDIQIVYDAVIYNVHTGEIIQHSHPQIIYY